MSEEMKKAALDYHANPTPGKLSVEISKPAETARHLSLAYSPGVAEPVREIAKDPENAYRYTGKQKQASTGGRVDRFKQRFASRIKKS